jgi:DNA (cytosine-5)-methyltransferase 1
MVPLHDFLEAPLDPLSWRAGTGFLRRARASKLRFAEGFLDSLDTYLAQLAS